MTEAEERQILAAWFAKSITPKEYIWIGKAVSGDEKIGYMFEADIYEFGDGPERNFHLWGVNAIDNSVCPYLA